MQFPNIDPILFQWGPLSLNFYSLSYMLGILIGLYYARYLCRKFAINITPLQQEQFVVWAVIAILIGGRLGYVLLYDPAKYFSNPISILKTYEGGMSFHGALISLIMTSYLFCRKHSISFLTLTDILAVICPIGLFLGRIANFFNGELFGRVTNVPWAVVFPYGGLQPRHPSQLYEAALEGILLFSIMTYCVFSKNMLRQQGCCSGIFLICYGGFRIFVECFRQPDIQIGFLFAQVTMGQILSVPMLCAGGWLYAKSSKASN